MNFKSWLASERIIWHERFPASLITGVAIALLSLFFELTTSNIVMFASLAASAAVVTHAEQHHLTDLRVIIFSYILALVVSLVVVPFDLSFTLAAFVVVSAVTLCQYLLNVFHPPAIAAALAFLLMEGGFMEYFIVFVAVIVLLVLLRVLTSLFYYSHKPWERLRQEFFGKLSK